MVSKEKNATPEKLENALTELEKIVEELDSSEIDLERSIELFEKGSRLSKFCYGKLEEAEKKVEYLVKKSPQPESKDDFEIQDFERWCPIL